MAPSVVYNRVSSIREHNCNLGLKVNRGYLSVRDEAATSAVAGEVSQS